MIYTITNYTESKGVWASDICFAEYNQAKEYLLNKGYIENNRWFIRNSNGWYLESKAIINKVKLYRKEEN